MNSGQPTPDSPLSPSGRREFAFIERTGFALNQWIPWQANSEKSIKAPALRLQVRARTRQSRAFHPCETSSAQ